MQLHGKLFHAAAGALLERLLGDASVVASCMRLMRNMSGRDMAKGAVFGETGRVTGVVGGGGGADAGVTEMFCGLVGGGCLRRADVADRCARDRTVVVVVRAAARRAAAQTMVAGCSRWTAPGGKGVAVGGGRRVAARRGEESGRWSLRAGQVSQLAAQEDARERMGARSRRRVAAVGRSECGRGGWRRRPWLRAAGAALRPGGKGVAAGWAV